MMKKRSRTTRGLEAMLLKATYEADHGRLLVVVLLMMTG
jgi:hypothetical protein